MEWFGFYEILRALTLWSKSRDHARTPKCRPAAATHDRHHHR